MYERRHTTTKSGDNDNSIYQQLGILQGTMDSVISTQHAMLKQTSQSEMAIRGDMEKMTQSITARLRSIEDDNENMRMQIAKLKWNQGLASGAIAFTITIITQLTFFFMNKFI